MGISPHSEMAQDFSSGLPAANSGEKLIDHLAMTNSLPWFCHGGNTQMLENLEPTYGKCVDL